MVYSVSGLATVGECDTMVQIAQERKDALVHSKNTLEYRMQGYADRSVKVSADLTAVSAELSSLETVFTTLPAGPVKDDVETRIKRLEYRKWLLEERSESYGSISLIEQQLEVGELEAQIAEIDACIDAINTHKATL